MPGPPQSRPLALWGEEELSRLRGSERNGLCPDAGAFLEKRAEKHFQNK